MYRTSNSPLQLQQAPYWLWNMMITMRPWPTTWIQAKRTQSMIFQSLLTQEFPLVCLTNQYRMLAILFKTFGRECKKEIQHYISMYISNNATSIQDTLHPEHKVCYDFNIFTSLVILHWNSPFLQKLRSNGSVAREVDFIFQIVN